MKKELLNIYIKKHDRQSCLDVYSSLTEKEKNCKDMVIFSLLLNVAETEEKAGIKGVFWRKDVFDLDSAILLYYQVKYAIRRIEYNVNLQDENEIIKLEISIQMLLMMISLFTINKKKVAKCLYDEYVKIGGIKTSKILGEFYNLN